MTDSRPVRKHLANINPKLRRRHNIRHARPVGRTAGSAPSTGRRELAPRHVHLHLDAARRLSCHHPLDRHRLGRAERDGLRHAPGQSADWWGSRTVPPSGTWLDSGCSCTCWCRNLGTRGWCGNAALRWRLERSEKVMGVEPERTGIGNLLAMWKPTVAWIPFLAFIWNRLSLQSDRIVTPRHVRRQRQYQRFTWVSKRRSTRHDTQIDVGLMNLPKIDRQYGTQAAKVWIWYFYLAPNTCWYLLVRSRLCLDLIRDQETLNFQVYCTAGHAGSLNLTEVSVSVGHLSPAVRGLPAAKSLSRTDLGHVVVLAKLRKTLVEFLDAFFVRHEQHWLPTSHRAGRHLDEL